MKNELDFYSDVEIDASWAQIIKEESSKEYFKNLILFLKQEIENGKIIYPHPKDIFNVFKLSSMSQVKVVIIGQDPYHGLGQAHGLSFSVRKGSKIPPSLQNIYKELKRDLNTPMPTHGHLVHWASQGVLLLNAVMTVEAHQAGSHQNKGWEQFTDQVIQRLHEYNENIVFMLWGAHAQKKGAVLSQDRHCVLKAPHPSPLSAHRGFIGCSHFSMANTYLVSHGHQAIDWSIPQDS
jgi:uracil-DNA glycosylase